MSLVIRRGRLPDANNSVHELETNKAFYAPSLGLGGLELVSRFRFAGSCAAQVWPRINADVKSSARECHAAPEGGHDFVVCKYASYQRVQQSLTAGEERTAPTRHPAQQPEMPTHASYSS